MCVVVFKFEELTQLLLCWEEEKAGEEKAGQE
jgi:hypothetical protein